MLLNALKPVDIFPMQVAGRFYPADANHCRAWMKLYFGQCKAFQSIGQIKALLAPHAGYSHCGGTAAQAFQYLKLRQVKPKRVVVIGPAHKTYFKGVRAPSSEMMMSLFGALKIDDRAIESLCAKNLIERSNEPFFGEHSIETHLPWLQKVIETEFEIIPLLVGDVDKQTLVEIINDVWGDEETVLCLSSDLSHFHHYCEAKKRDHLTKDLIDTQSEQGWDKDKACGYRILDAMAYVSKSKQTRATVLEIKSSGDHFGAHDRVVGYGAAVWEYNSEAQICPEDRKALIGLAKNIIYHSARTGIKPVLNYDFNTPMPLRALRASFVTLKKNSQLRGCIGTISPQYSLLQDVAYNSYKSAFEDPRFEPVKMEDVQELDCQISILSSLSNYTFDSEDHFLEQIIPNHEGVVLMYQTKKALFLPSVWEKIPNKKNFISALKRKMGCDEGFWSPDMKAQRFTCESFSASLA